VGIRTQRFSLARVLTGADITAMLAKLAG